MTDKEIIIKLRVALTDLLAAGEQVERAWVGDAVDMSIAVDACLLAVEKAKEIT